jgi:hypothetical protein
MNPMHRASGLVVALAIAIATACSNSKEPARHALEAVHSAVTAVAPQALRYLPDQFSSLKTQEDQLQVWFDEGDFKQVLADAPALLNATQALSATAAAKKGQIVKAMTVQWAALAESIPDSLAAVQARIDVLAKNKKQPAGVDLAAARASMADAPTLWDQAQQSVASGDVEAAVENAQKVQSRIQSAATALKFPLPAGATA